MKLSTTTAVLGFFSIGLLATALTAGGCGSDSGADAKGTGAGAGGSGATGSTGAFGQPDGGTDPSQPDACAQTSVQANYQTRKVDIIFVIDNSGSMTEQITSVQNNINNNFASIIAESGVDYRVIMLSEYGSAVTDQSICIGPPLGAGACDPPTTPQNHEPVFYHYSTADGIDSTDSLCKILDTLKGGVPDAYGLAPTGWSTWLRPDALKVFVEITDDNTRCTTQTLAEPVTLDDSGETAAQGTTVAHAFDAALTGLAPEFFGTADARNYAFFSIVGLQENDPATTPWPPTAPVLEGSVNQCGSPEDPIHAVGPGTGYQTLSVMTNGLRYPVCEVESYDAMFVAVANTVISGAKLECDFKIPPAPSGQEIDLKTIQVSFKPSDGGEARIFQQVDDLAACKPDAFYIDAEERTIKFCPDTCRFAQADNSAELNILYGCDVTAR